MALREHLSLLGALIICGIGGAALWSHLRTESRPARPAAFAGSSSCRGCHSKFYELWSTSHHGLAMQPFTAEFAHRNLTLNQPPISVGDITYAVESNAKGSAIVERSGKGARRYPLELAMGGKNVYYFLTTLERGRLQVLPLAYDVRAKSWIDSTGSMVMHESRPSAAPVDWRDRLLTFNTSCYGCHVSQLATNYDEKSDSYHTEWAEPGINCETCHGPSAGHVQTFRQAQERKQDRPPDDWRIVSVKNLTKPQRNDLCSSCHAKLTAGAPGFSPGDRFFDYYNLVALESADFYPDGRDYRENYTLTSWMMSPCAKSGELDCIHCHTSSGRYRFHDEKVANNACLPCHEERVRNVAAHTRHKPENAGKCISCHMPTTEYARMRRSDHSMRPPTPATTIAYKSPNACHSCHGDKDAPWVDQQVRKWYKRDYQAPVLQLAALIDGARNGDWGKLPQILAYLGRSDRDPVFAASLARLLRNCRDSRRLTVLVELVKDPSPLVRTAAAEALSQDVTPQTAGALLRAADDGYRMVRIQAGAALARFQPGELDGPARAILDRAVGEYVASLKSRPDDFYRRLNLGVLYSDRRQWQESLAEYQAAIRLRPDDAAPLVNASLVYNQLGEDAKAEESLRKAIRIDPRNSPAHFNLGLLLAEKKRMQEAAQALRRALEVDPANAGAALNLAVIVSKDHPDESIALCRRAAAFAPLEPKYAYTLAFYLVQRGDVPGAAAALQRAVDAGIADAPSYRLLVEIREQQGDLAGAAEICRKAANNLSLPQQLRVAFAVKASQQAANRTNR